MMHRRIMNIFMLLTVGTIFTIGSCSAGNSNETKKSAKINWVSYDEGVKIATKENKLMFIDFYTTWCKFCVKMDKETFAVQDIAEYMNENFVNIKVNAESKTKMKLADSEISGQELSRSFGVRGYPSYWFVKTDGEKVTNISGYKPAEQFRQMIKYIGDDHYTSKTYQEYMDEQIANN